MNFIGQRSPETVAKRSKELKELFGEYGLPPHFKVLTDAEVQRLYGFAGGIFGCYGIEAIEYRQIQLKAKDYPLLGGKYDTTYISGQFFFTSRQQGIAHVHLNQVGRYVWAEFGCPHDDMEHKNLRMCLNRYTCRKCGFSEEIDSSD